MNVEPRTADPAAREHLRALDTVRRAKNWLVLLAVLAPAAHLAAWTAVEFGGVMNPAPPTPPSANAVEGDPSAEPADTAGGHSATGSADSTASSSPEGAAASSGWTPQRWENLLRGTLPLAEFVGRCMILLLLATLLLAVLICLNGRLGGVSDLIAAFYLCVIAAALFVPWDRLTFDATNIFGAFTTVEKLQQHVEANRAVPPEQAARLMGYELGVSERTWSAVLDGLRFGAVPLLSMLLLLRGGARFGRGFRAARGASGPTLPMKVI